VLVENREPVSHLFLVDPHIMQGLVDGDPAAGTRGPRGPEADRRGPGRWSSDPPSGNS
jgi:hypothetical protein